MNIRNGLSLMVIRSILIRHFPKADHDDGPDALEMLWRLAVGGFVSLRDAFERVPRQSPWGVRPSEDDDFDSFDTYGGWT